MDTGDFPVSAGTVQSEQLRDKELKRIEESRHKANQEAARKAEQDAKKARKEAHDERTKLREQLKEAKDACAALEGDLEVARAGASSESDELKMLRDQLADNAYQEVQNKFNIDLLKYRLAEFVNN